MSVKRLLDCTPSDLAAYRKTDLLDANYRAADQLLQTVRIDPAQPLIVATLVSVDRVHESSRLGRLFSEQIAGRLVQRGLNVVEPKLRETLAMQRDQGELLLSRELREVARSHAAQAVVVGTYAASATTLYVSLKMVVPTGNSVVAACDYALPLDDNVRTLLLALDCDVELYKAGRMPIAQFAALPYDRDILTHVYIKKTPGLAVHYQSVRATQTDFPILTCAAARTADGAYRFAIGARPMKAMLVCPTAAPDELPAAVQAAVPTGSNLRGSAAYRTHLVGVLVKRAVQALGNLEVL